MPNRGETQMIDTAIDVLTLAEAAAYLRVSHEEVLALVRDHELPGRKIGDEWRFLKQGLADWLVDSSERQRLLRHAGALKNDPELESMLKRIYEDRGRKPVEDAE